MWHMLSSSPTRLTFQLKIGWGTLSRLKKRHSGQGFLSFFHWGLWGGNIKEPMQQVVCLSCRSSLQVTPCMLPAFVEVLAWLGRHLLSHLAWHCENPVDMSNRLSSHRTEPPWCTPKVSGLPKKLRILYNIRGSGVVALSNSPTRWQIANHLALRLGLNS